MFWRLFMAKMKILIDTHVFLWIFLEPSRFSKKARKFIEDIDQNSFYFSDVSAWESSIKYGLGKLRLPSPPEEFIPDRVRIAEYSHLRIDLRHVLKVHSLPLIHRDPFDRLLVSQSKADGFTLLTADPIFEDYDAQTLKFKDIL